MTVVKLGDQFEMVVGPVEVVEVGEIFTKVSWRNADGKTNIALVDTKKLKGMRKIHGRDSSKENSARSV
jgi:hypothetical protein